MVDSVNIENRSLRLNVELLLVFRDRAKEGRLICADKCQTHQVCLLEYRPL